MSLAVEDFATAGQSVVGRELSAPAFNHLMRPPPGLMLQLPRLHEAVGKLAAVTPEILAHPEVARAVEQELVRAMVHCVSDTEGVTSHAYARTTVMRRFERAIAESANSRSI